MLQYEVCTIVEMLPNNCGGDGEESRYAKFAINPTIMIAEGGEYLYGIKLRSPLYS